MKNGFLAFLNAVLGRIGDNRFTSIEIIENRTHIAEIIGDKSSVLDVRARTADGTLMNIEVQFRNLGNIDRWSLFYWSLEYSRLFQIQPGSRPLPRLLDKVTVRVRLDSSVDLYVQKKKLLVQELVNTLKKEVP